MQNCKHPKVKCINQYELIRKYICEICFQVMMCSCDESFGSQFLPHQIGEASEPETKKRIPVTLGFQENICDKCRGIPEKAFPKAETYGRGSKVYRYYWREIAFETINRFEKWCENEGYADWLIAMVEQKHKFESIEREVAKEIKHMHESCPKYIYQEESQAEVFTRYKVEVIDLDGIYIKTPERKISLLDGRDICTAEEFVERYFMKPGYNVLQTESIPFHVLFGVFMWVLIQDHLDELCRSVSFGERSAFEKGTKGELITTLLPEDFGGPGYFKRRKEVIKAHIDSIPEDKEDLLRTFNYWIDGSYGFRQYLWAHREEHIEKDRKILGILPPTILKRILDYLIQDYWERYLGWPDLLVYKQNEFFFVEVKSSKDKLKENQKIWIRYNFQDLKLPFKIVKIHKKAEEQKKET